MKAFGREIAKGFFPCEWMHNPAKLECTDLPTPEALHSFLRGEDILVENQTYCQRNGADGEIATFRDFLVCYNNANVEPFLEAIAKQVAVYAKKAL